MVIELFVIGVIYEYRVRYTMSTNPFDSIDNEFRKDAGCTSELDYIEQTSWLLFLKYLDAMENSRK